MLIKIASLITHLAGRLGGEMVVPYGQGYNFCARLLSVCRQVGAHLWHRGLVDSTQQRDSNPRPSTFAPACHRQALSLRQIIILD